MTKSENETYLRLNKNNQAFAVSADLSDRYVVSMVTTFGALYNVNAYKVPA